MMDTQRLIALVIFSFTSLLLWDAWQKHNAPKIPAPTAATATPSTRPSPVPSPSAQLAAPGAPPPAAPSATPGSATGKPVAVKTDLFDIELNTLGGDIRRLTLLTVFSKRDFK